MLEIKMGIDIDTERNRRLCSWMNGIPAPPLRLSILPTNVCNLRCRMCGISRGVREGRFRIVDEFRDDEWLPLIKEGAEMGIPEWWICGGGEPLMRRDLTLEIIKTIKRYSPQSRVELTTNGTRFTEEMLHDLVAIGLDKMQFSIDAPDAATHDWVRRKRGTFEKVTWAIQRFSELKEEMGKRFPRLTVNCVLNGKNYNRLEEFISLAERIGIEHLNVTPLRVIDEVCLSMEKVGLILNQKQKDEAFRSAERAKRLGRKRGVGFEFFVNRGLEVISENEVMEKFTKEETLGPQNASKRKSSNPFLGLRCYEPWLNISIDAWGNPGHCVTVSKGDPLFSFRNHTLQDVWYGEFFLNARSRLMKNKLTAACAHCTVTDMLEKVGVQFNEWVANSS